MKLAGVIAVILSTATVGFSMYDFSRKKVLICRELTVLCDCLRRDFMYRATPISELVSSIITKSKLKHLTFIKTENITENLPVISPLTQEENGEITAFLGALGRSDTATQLDLVSGFRDYISDKEEKYKTSHTKNGSVYLSFGLFSGILIALVMA